MEKEIKIPVKERDFFRMYLAIRQPFDKLRERDTDIFAELLYYEYKYSSISDEKVKWKMVFDYSTKLEIASKLGISTDIIRNSLTYLRKKGKIGKGNIIPKKFLLRPNDKNSLKFEFVIDNSQLYIVKLKIMDEYYEEDLESDEILNSISEEEMIAAMIQAKKDIIEDSKDQNYLNRKYAKEGRDGDP